MMSGAMKSKKRDRLSVIPNSNNLESSKASRSERHVQTDHDLFLQAFEKPTQIYRYLKLRHAHSPIFLQRTLGYMVGRCKRKANTRASFRVEDMLAKAQLDFSKHQLHSYKSEYLNLTFTGFYDSDVGDCKDVDADVYLMKIYHKKRKDASSPVQPVFVGTASVPCNPSDMSTAVQSLTPVDDGGIGCVVSVPAEKFSACREHYATPMSYVLIIQVTCCHRHKNVDTNAGDSTQPSKKQSTPSTPASDTENQHPPKKRLRSSRDSAGSMMNSPASDRVSLIDNEMTNTRYGTRLFVYDKQRRCLLTDGVYLLEMNETGREQNRPVEGDIKWCSPSMPFNKQTTWETVRDEQNVPTTELFEKNTQIRFTLAWGATPLQKRNEYPVLSICEDITQNTNSKFYDYKKAGRWRQVVGGKCVMTTKDVTAKKEGGATGTRRQRIFYQFLYNNSARQQTEAPDDLRCPWCSLKCVKLYSLLAHLRCCHGRFNFIYIEHPKGARIDVSVNEFYDGSYVGNPQDLHSHIGYAFNRNGPTRRVPVTHILVSRPRKRTFDIAEFLEPETEGTKNRPVVHGHNRLYYHTLTSLPVRPCDLDVDSEGESDPEWLRQKTQKMIDEFTDVNEGEKEVMKMWNLHMMRHGYIGDCQLPTACQTFVKEYGADIIRLNLKRNLLLHLVNLVDFGLITPMVMYRTAVQFFKLRNSRPEASSTQNTIIMPSPSAAIGTPCSVTKVLPLSVDTPRGSNVPSTSTA